MRPDDIHRLLRRRPFRPFRLHLTDGTAYDVPHPEQAVVARSTVGIGLLSANGPDSSEDTPVIVALLHITRLELITPAATASST